MDEAGREAFDGFARPRLTALMRFAHALTGDPDEAADLVQDALVCAPRTAARGGRAGALFDSGARARD